MGEMPMGNTGASDDNQTSSSLQRDNLIDFIIPNTNEEEVEKHQGRQFQISYDLDQHCYKIKDLGIGYGVFVKLSDNLALKDNYLINMGESYIVANLLQPQQELMGVVATKKLPQKLRLKIFSVAKADQPDIYVFQNEE